MTTVPGVSVRPLRFVLVIVVTSGLLAGCGEVETRDFCTQYDDVVERADELRELDPQSDGVEEMRAQADELRAELDQLQAVSEGRLDSVISSLRTAVNDFKSTAVDQGQEALDAARPALEDARDEVEEAWSVVELMAQNQCGDV